MAFMDIDLEILPPQSGTRKKPKNLIGGMRRKILRAALAKLKTLQRAEEREGVRAARNHYTPIFVMDPPGSEMYTNFLLIISQLESMLALKG